jgi:hypothetical protein
MPARAGGCHYQCRCSMPRDNDDYVADAITGPGPTLERLSADHTKARHEIKYPIA